MADVGCSAGLPGPLGRAEDMNGNAALERARVCSRSDDVLSGNGVVGRCASACFVLSDGNFHALLHSLQCFAMLSKNKTKRSVQVLLYSVCL